MGQGSVSVDLVITDIGGVLIKTDEAILACIEQAADELRIPRGSFEATYEVFGVTLEAYVRAYLPKEHKDRTDECYAKFLRIYPSQAMHLLAPFDGVDETLVTLHRRGIALAVISGMLRNHVDANLLLLTFRDWATTLSIEDYGEDHKRPDPKALLDIMERLGVGPQRTLYVGDSHNDVQMAKNAGVTSVGVRSGALDNDYLLKANPDFLIDTFAELADLLGA